MKAIRLGSVTREKSAGINPPLSPHLCSATAGKGAELGFSRDTENQNYTYKYTHTKRCERYECGARGIPREVMEDGLLEEARGSKEKMR